MDRLEIDAELLAFAVEDQRIFAKDGWAKLQEAVTERTGDLNETAALLRGFGQDSIKKMRNDKDIDRPWPRDLPRLVIQAIDDLSGVNVRKGADEDFVQNLRSSVSLRLGAERANEEGEKVLHTLKDLRIEFSEIKEKIAGPDDREMAITIGFDAAHFQIDAAGQTPLGKNLHIGELTAESDLEAEGQQEGYIGHYKMTFKDDSPLRWELTPNRTVLLRGVLEVRDDLARVYTAPETELHAYITVPSSALCVRLNDNGEEYTSNSQSEAHRRKMEKAMIRKEIAKRQEFIICDEALPTEPARP